MREVLSEAVRDLSDPRIGFVTITGVQCARDFRSAKVFVSVFGDEDSKQRSFAGLRSCQGLLQRAVAREVKLRNTPQLEFVPDTTIDQALHIEKLLHEGEDA